MIIAIIMILIILILALLLFFIIKLVLSGQKLTDEEEYERDKNKNRYTSNQNDFSDFHMVIQDVFSITGRGTIVTGIIESGTINKGDSVLIRTTDGSTIETIVTAVESFRKILASATKGDNVGLLLDKNIKSQLNRGDIISSKKI